MHKWFHSAEQKGRAAGALNEKYFETTSSPEPLFQIQNKFTEIFLITPWSKTARMVSIRSTKGHQSSRLEMSLYGISSLTTGPNSISFHKIFLMMPSTKIDQRWPPVVKIEISLNDIS